jgi:hypothetical protein
MIKLYSLFIFLFLGHSSLSQILYGPKITSMGNAGVALQNVWSNNSNAAGLTAIQAPTFAAGYENRFSLNDLSAKSVVGVLPIKNYRLGASFQTYGNSSYSLSKTGVSLAKAFGKNFFTALTFNYHQVNIENYGNARAFSVEAGMQIEALPNFWIGAHLANPNQSKFEKNTEELIPAHLKFGAAFMMSNKLMISSEIEKVLDAQMDFKIGLEYRIIELLALRGGISANTFKQYAGFGLNHQKFEIDFAFSSHPVLGYSPQIAVAYAF